MRTRTLSFSLSPPHSMPWNPHSDAVTEQRSKHIVNVEDIPVLSTALSRRTRRHKQLAHEKEIAQRKRDGKKPFYLTVDSEGKPYGIGKPAWMAEIGKLATGLDLSCTHISKQTYEAVSTFKARLNERFEYSGPLNEDHMRSIMGKAVTRKRTELISLIQKGGSQPLHIDHEVWGRLVKLAASKQRKYKSEQGRYANACRRTYGRTGSRGINGIRERLREHLKRSPDPEEIEIEMKRDKGYGGYKKQKRGEAEEHDNVSKQVLSDENSTGSQTTRPGSEDNMSEGKQGCPRQLLPSASKVRTTAVVMFLEWIKHMMFITMGTTVWI